MLCDTGPLVALINKRDADHQRCVKAMKSLSTELVTTWACITESMYLLGKWGGIRPQDVLWEYLAQGLVSLHEPADGEWHRMRELMNDYADTPMDFADASLVAAGETLNQRRIFTTDRHFRVYRQQQGHAFEVVP